MKTDKKSAIPKAPTAKKTAPKKKTSGALAAAAVGRAATAQVRAHSKAGNFANTGTNVSYEGATAPGSGLGTGYTSGQPATGAKITANSDFDQNRGGAPAKKSVAKKRPCGQNRLVNSASIQY